MPRLLQLLMSRAKDLNPGPRLLPSALSASVADLPIGLFDILSTPFSLVPRPQITRPADKLVSSLLRGDIWSMRRKWELFGSLSCCSE